MPSLTRSPILVRTVPFAVFVCLTFAQGCCGEAGRYWLYLAKTVLAAGLLWTVRTAVPEMRWRISIAAVVAGVAVFFVWVQLESAWFTSGSRAPF